MYPPQRIKVMDNDQNDWLFQISLRFRRGPVWMKNSNKIKES